MFHATKEFTFDCAHMLSGHNGACKNLHGHTYKLLVTVSSEEVQWMEVSSDGMVMDFKDLKEIVSQEIISKYDHAFVTDITTRYAAERSIVEVLKNAGLKVVEFPTRPTAENMSKIFFELINNRLNSDHQGYAEALCKCTQVEVYETPTSCATYRE